MVQGVGDIDIVGAIYGDAEAKAQRGAGCQPAVAGIAEAPGARYHGQRPRNCHLHHPAVADIAGVHVAGGIHGYCRHCSQRRTRGCDGSGRKAPGAARYRIDLALRISGRRAQDQHTNQAGDFPSHSLFHDDFPLSASSNSTLWLERKLWYTIEGKAGGN